MPIPTTNQNPALACDLTQAEALRILADLSAKHGPGTLAALLGAACAFEIREALDELEDEDESVFFDRDWLVAFGEHPAFVQCLGAEEICFDVESCRY